MFDLKYLLNYDCILIIPTIQYIDGIICKHKKESIFRWNGKCPKGILLCQIGIFGKERILLKDGRGRLKVAGPTLKSDIRDI